MAGTELILVRSSGNALLDQQAIALLGRAVGQTAMPPGLLGRSVLLPVVLEFGIDRQAD